MAPLLLLGIGNVLMGDEGVGIHAVRALGADEWPDEVEIVDGGTGGFHLLEYLHRFPAVVLIDAAMDGRAAGTVSTLRPRYASDFPRSLTAHDIGLRDLVEAAVLTRRLPDITLVTVSIEAVQPMTTALTPAVAAAVERVRQRVKATVSEVVAVAHA